MCARKHQNTETGNLVEAQQIDTPWIPMACSSRPCLRRLKPGPGGRYGTYGIHGTYLVPLTYLGHVFQPVDAAPHQACEWMQKGVGLDLVAESPWPLPLPYGKRAPA